MYLGEINPFVRNALNNCLGAHTKNDIFVPLRARDCRLFYMTGGSGRIVIENVEYELCPGALILLPAGTEYMWKPEGSIRFLTVNFDYTEHYRHIKASFHPHRSGAFPGALESVSFSDELCLNSAIFLPRLTLLENRIRELVFAFCTNEPYREENLSALMRSVLISIVGATKTAQHTTPEKNRLAYDMIQFLQNNYHKPITGEDISKHFHFSITYINRVFREKTGCTVHRFLLEHRIKIAMEMLGSGFYQVGEVAEAVGFCDIYHFNKTFKKMIGKTPLQYRRE
ncbi:MAG: helix-turn-helix domain-containing protein [Clostridia bacterium]|nr:helix-turn-helix domain-containing protein [Clostridia bacterium]